MKKRGQVSLEHLLILGMVILIIIPVVVIVYSSTKSSTNDATEIQLEELCNEISSKAETLKQLGPNSWASLDLKIPKNVINISVKSNEIVIRYITEGGVNEVVCFSDVDLEKSNLGSALEDLESGGRIKIRIEPKGPFVCITPEGGDCQIVQCNDGIDNDGDLCADEADLDCSVNNPLDDSENETFGCVSPVCGNYVAENWVANPGDVAEVCDGPDGTLLTCQAYWAAISDPRALKLPQGMTKCGPACDEVYDDTDCLWCGDGEVTGLEQCDGSNLNGKTCELIGHYNHGWLTCRSSCTFSTANCWWQVCGNNQREKGEQCDGTSIAACSAGQCCSLACTCTNDCGGAASPVFIKEEPGGPSTMGSAGIN